MKIAVVAIGGLALVIGVGIKQAAAEMQIIESNVPEFAVGAVVPDNAAINLPSGGRVKVLMLPSNATKIIQGEGGVARSAPWGGTRKPIKKKEE